MSQHVNEKSFVSYLCTHCTMTDGLFLSPEFVLLMCVTCRLPYGFTGLRVSSTFKGSQNPIQAVSDCKQRSYKEWW